MPYDVNMAFIYFFPNLESRQIALVFAISGLDMKIDRLEVGMCISSDHTYKSKKMILPRVLLDIFEGKDKKYSIIK